MNSIRSKLNGLARGGRAAGCLPHGMAPARVCAAAGSAVIAKPGKLRDRFNQKVGRGPAAIGGRPQMSIRNNEMALERDLRRRIGAGISSRYRDEGTA